MRVVVSVKKTIKVIPLVFAFCAIGAFHSAVFANSFIIGQGGYLYEHFHAVGSVEVTESFTFYNLGPGAGSRFNNGAGGLVDARPEDNPTSGAVSNFVSGARVNVVIDAEDIIELVVMSAPGWRDLFFL